MSRVETEGQGRLTRSETFLPNDEVDSLFVSQRGANTSRFVAGAAAVALFCAILSLI